MGWTNPRTWAVGEIVTAAIQNTHVRDLFRYLKGLDGVPTIESGLIIDNTDGDEYLKLPLLSTAEAASVLGAEGKFAFDEQTHTLKYHNGTAVKQVNLLSDCAIASEAEGDILYRGASAWSRLEKGAAYKFLRMNAGATAPEWATGSLVSKRVSGSYNGATGNQAVTGAGFAPNSAIILSHYIEGGVTIVCQGFVDSSRSAYCTYQAKEPTIYIRAAGTAIYTRDSAASVGYIATVASWDVDGLTFSFTKMASAIQPVVYSILFLR